jgi:hypothetical protein
VTHKYVATPCLRNTDKKPFKLEMKSHCQGFDFEDISTVYLRGTKNVISGVNFTKILRAAFATIFLSQKSTNLKFK